MSIECRLDNDRLVCESETQQRIIIKDIDIGDKDNMRLFNCGNKSMNAYIYSEALLNHVLGEGITRVVLDENESEIIAYYTLKCTNVKVEDLQMGEESREIPSIEISRLAVCSNWQDGNNGFHLGTSLVGYIISTIKDEIASKAGCRWIIIHAVQEKVKWYQEQFGFDFLIDETPDKYGTVSMYLDITDWEKHRQVINLLK